MAALLQANQVTEFGLSTEWIARVNHYLQQHSPQIAWQKISRELLTPQLPFALHLFLFQLCYPTWQSAPHTAVAWTPEKNFIATTHLAHWMAELRINSLTDFHHWTITHAAEFYQHLLAKLKINFMTPPTQLCDLSAGVENPRWLVGAKFNIIESCFNAVPEKTAIITQNQIGALQKISYAELEQLVNRIANSLIHCGLGPGDAIAINMPMNFYAVSIYLAIIKMGGVVVAIADSFSAPEIATRLRIANTKAIFTQDYMRRNAKEIYLYEKVQTATTLPAIVLPYGASLTCTLRPQDIAWEKFLVTTTKFKAYAADATTHCNILFSSGTTGDPKAIPWTHTTPLKAAMDAYFHHDIQPQDIFAWPTNLGWMMGPWLIFATLLNQATLALYEDIADREFGKFVQNAKVSLLGLVPSLVANWRQTKCMEGLDWQQIKCFSSSGECSNPADMLYLMFLAGYKPIIEYCGGTEIGGAYISSTLIENNCPAVFTTKAMGSDFILLDEFGKPTSTGEVALIPPAIGLSTELLNADHQQIYFAGMPSCTGKLLRRHGDQIQHFAEGGYCVLGRTDDTMNLGGIKVSSAEIERVLTGIENISETAAIAVTDGTYGPSQLVIYAVTATKNLDKADIKKLMQLRINQALNPLFKISDVVFLTELPKTASHKIMRRLLRKQYVAP